jgi:hypothetical protein
MITECVCLHIHLPVTSLTLATTALRTQLHILVAIPLRRLETMIDMTGDLLPLKDGGYPPPPAVRPRMPPGYPIYSHFTTKHQSKQGAFNYGNTNSSGQVPKLINKVSLVDPATPQSANTKPSFQDLTLVFSDKFNIDGRTFWPGSS